MKFFLRDLNDLIETNQNIYSIKLDISNWKRLIEMTGSIFLNAIASLLNLFFTGSSFLHGHV